MAGQSTPVSFPGIRQLPDVQQYWGIKYATLADAFARGVPTTSYSPVTMPGDDPTVHPVPLPVADPKGCDVEQMLIQHILPHQEYRHSATECLTLNVSAPSPRAQEHVAGPYPVVAFVHGGGFVTGSANWPQWDLARLVQASVTAGTPVVAVGINYRLGPFGFLTSPAFRDAGYLPNNGLHDQKLALRWIQKFIGDFGGDPSRVTYLGSSMGAASGYFHLQSEEPLFHQFVALAGSPLLRPAPLAVGDLGYVTAAKALELDTLSPEDQVATLLRIPAEEIYQKLAAIHVYTPAVVDNDIIPEALSYKALAEPESVQRLLPGLRWCKALWSSDSGLDGMVLVVTALSSRIDNLSESLRKSISLSLGDKTQAILSAYRLDDAAAALNTSNTPSDPDSDAQLPPIAAFLTDIQFSQPARASAAAAAAAAAASDPTVRVYRSVFDAPNPWPGAWQGQATHTLDLIFALQNYNDVLPPDQRAVAERIGRDILTFAHGGEPFRPYREGFAMAYAGSVDESGPVSVQAGEPGPRATLRRAGLETPDVLDRLLDATALFLSGASV